jgi:hypothetical protein
MFLSGGNPHLTSWFGRVEICPTQNSKISEPPPTSKIRWATYYQVSAIEPPTIYIHTPSTKVLGVRECVKSPTLNNRWHEDMFVSGDNVHLTNQLCRVELGPT